jgi:hypothetical protein
VSPYAWGVSIHTLDEPAVDRGVTDLETDDPEPPRPGGSTGVLASRAVQEPRTQEQGER